MKQRHLLATLAAAGLTLLAGCGGGGGGGTATPLPALPSITTQPQSQTVAEGASVSFSVTASGATGYQWQRNGTAIANATAAAYSETAQLANSGATYRVVVSNSAGSVTSSNATLTVTAAAARTAVGSPIAPAASASIGTAGGSLSDASGLVTVTVPAGAFAAATTVSIAPIADTTPGGLGASYSVSWSGTAAQPIAVRLGRLADCRLGSTGALIGVAEQRAVAGTNQGDWYRLAPTQRQATGATDNCVSSTAAIVEEVTVALTESRVLSLYAALALKAPTQDVAAGTTVTIAVAGLCADPLAAGASPASAPLPPCVAAALPTATSLTASAGSLTAGASAAALSYTAPSGVTALTPVQLTVGYASVGAAANVSVPAVLRVAP